MKPNVTTLERAFELAASGECSGLDDLRMRLRREGYEVDQVQGRSLRKQLAMIMGGARVAQSSTQKQ